MHSPTKWLQRVAFRFCRLGSIGALLLFSSGSVMAQPAEKVLTLTGAKQGARNLSQDHGANGLWQRLLKLKTTASVLHTQAHPDDEYADVVTFLSRGQGARSALLSLNRGESGANILGPELFDQLGILRTQEFLLAASYYGLDDLYFTSLADYGYSKRVAETYGKWGKDNILREMVRVIRLNRPLVIVSRFHGTERDGHGNHQAAGEMTPLAFDLAGDPAAFPELLTEEGLRPWKALKLYRGGIKPAANEAWNVGVNTGEYCPWLGQTYKNFSLLGYSMHRSQVGGHRNEVNGPSTVYYERLQSRVKSAEKENSFFDGIDTTLTGLFSVTGEGAPEGMLPLLAQIETAVNKAVALYDVQHLSAVVPPLTDGLSKTRKAIELAAGSPEALFMLRLKERQFMDAINTALAIKLQAVAGPKDAKKPAGYFAPPVTMGFAVAGKPFTVDALLHNNSDLPLSPTGLRLLPSGNWPISTEQPPAKTLAENENLQQSFTVSVPDDAPPTQPYFSRQSIQESSYRLTQKKWQNLPEGPADLRVAASYLVNGEPVEMTEPVVVRQANLPYGYQSFTLKVAPALVVNLKPALGIIPLDGVKKPLAIEAEVVNNFDGAITGNLSLKVPAGWRVQPASVPFAFGKAGERGRYSLLVIPGPVAQNTYTVEAVATANGKSYNTGSYLISYRDLDQSLLYAPAVTTVKGINVAVAKGLRVGYVMGGGDDVPTALQQLGATVQLLNATDLAAGRFDQFDVIIIGTRAYAVRPDLVTYNRSLLSFAKNGGHLLVLYQSPEFMPEIMAPYPARLPGNAEEISEEDAPVKLVAPSHPVLQYPNKISAADFDNWIEQRGSKFFSEWDSAYQPIIESNDAGQAPQRGGWLMADYGKGHYTYFAYALQRQLPYGVAGAYRLLANLVSYGKTKKAR